MKKCKYCAEEIQDDAIYCRYCHQKQIRARRSRPTTHQLPAIVWGILVGSIMALVTFTQFQDEINTIFGPGSYSRLDNLSKMYLGDLVIGSVINFVIWTSLTTVVIMIFRKIYSNSSEVLALFSSLITLAIIFIGMIFFRGIYTLAKSAETALEVYSQPTPENTPVLIHSTPLPKHKTYFPEPIPGAEIVISSEKDSASSNDYNRYREFFKVDNIDGFQLAYMQMGRSLPPYNEFYNIINAEMTGKGFTLHEKGENYFIFYNKNINKYIGFIYSTNDDSNSYQAAQW